MKLYRLEKGNVVPTDDHVAWIDDVLLERPRGIRTFIDGNMVVYTSFLGFAMDDQQPPLLWETGLVRKKDNRVTVLRSYPDMAAAMIGHTEAVVQACIEAGLCPPTETKTSESAAAASTEEPKIALRNACYKCKFRRPSVVPHSLCLNIVANVRGSERGKVNGWFNWPVNFDPVWLVECDGFQPTES